MINKISVSVIITCKDLHEYLNECVESVLAQTMQATEIIIIHDGCKPAPAYKNTITVYRDQNRGVSYSRNEGVNICNSDNVIFLDADDCLNEFFIEALINQKVKSKVDIIYPDVLLWSYWHKDVKYKNGWHRPPNKITWKNMQESNQLVVTSLIPKKLYLSVGGMESLPILEDYDFYLKCLKAGATFSKAETAVLKYRQRENGRNRQRHDLKNDFYWQIKEKYADK